MYKVIGRTTTPFEMSAWLVIGDITLVDYLHDTNTITLSNVIFYVSDSLSGYAAVFGIGNTGYSYLEDSANKCGPPVRNPIPGPGLNNYLDRNLWSSIINYYSYVKIELNDDPSYGKIKFFNNCVDDNKCRGITWIKLISNGYTIINVKNVRICNQYTGGCSNFWYNNNHNEDNNTMLIDTGDLLMEIQDPNDSMNISDFIANNRDGDIHIESYDTEGYGTTDATSNLCLSDCPGNCFIGNDVNLKVTFGNDGDHYHEMNNVELNIGRTSDGNRNLVVCESPSGYDNIGYNTSNAGRPLFEKYGIIIDAISTNIYPYGKIGFYLKDDISPGPDAETSTSPLPSWFHDMLSPPAPGPAPPAPPTVASCNDNSNFIDHRGQNCEWWSTYLEEQNISGDCNRISRFYNYTPENINTLKDNCPVTCGTCPEYVVPTASTADIGPLPFVAGLGIGASLITGAVLLRKKCAATPYRQVSEGEGRP